MAISLQRLTIYLYSAHRAVIFAIAQLFCYRIHVPYVYVIPEGNVRSTLLTSWPSRGVGHLETCSFITFNGVPS